MAALASRAGSRSAGSVASRPSRSVSAAMARNSAAVSRQESGAPGADQPAATSSAWARISATDGMPHSPHRLPRRTPLASRSGPIYSVYSAAHGPGAVS